MLSQTTIAQSNGGHRTLGWARMVTKFGAGVTFKLYDDCSAYGRSPFDPPETTREGFVFTRENTPEELLQYISKRHFKILRESRPNQLNWSPAVLQSLSRNGVYVNKKHIPQGSSRILQHGDYIKILKSETLFQFLEDREFDVAGIPSTITYRYHIDSYFGKGAQSMVRLIHDKNSQAKAAMKVISTGKYESESEYSYSKRIQHMRDEVGSMQQLKHKNIIGLIDVVEDTSHLFIIMQFGEGGDLLQYTKSFPGSFLPEPEAKFCFYQICEGLDAIHKMNIAHRDLKAENIFIANVGNEKLMKIGDFGFSKSADDHLLTQLGTKCFFPPEIQDRFGEYSLKADIWTLGCLFYACSTGTFPFHHTYIGSLSQQIREAAVDYFRPQFFNSLPHLQQLIENMLQVDPNQRPGVNAILHYSPWFNCDPVFAARLIAFKKAIADTKNHSTN